MLYIDDTPDFARVQLILNFYKSDTDKPSFISQDLTTARELVFFKKIASKSALTFETYKTIDIYWRQTCNTLPIGAEDLKERKM